MTNPQDPTPDRRPHPDRPETWPLYPPLIIAHDVGRVRDRSTAVIGGRSPFAWFRCSGILESARAAPRALWQRAGQRVGGGRSAI